MNELDIDPHYPLDLSHLPSPWVVAYIGDIIKDIRSGFSSGIHNSEGRGVVHLRPMNIDRLGRIVLSDVRYIDPENDLRVTPGDVLFNNTNSPELVGKTAPVIEEGDWAFSNHMTRLRPPPGISHRFVAYQLHFLWAAGYFRYRSTQHVNQASISGRTLAGTVPLVVPPTKEQLRIVAEIEKQFARLDETETSLANALGRLESYSRTVLRQAAEGTLVRSEAEIARQQGYDYETGEQLLQRVTAQVFDKGGPEQLRLLDDRDNPLATQSYLKRQLPLDLPNPVDVPALPEGWIWAHMRHVGEITLGRQRAPKHHTGPYMRPYLRVANVFENRIDTTDVLQMNFTPEEYETYRLEMGDILLNEGQSLELVGRAAMYRNEVPGACFQKTLIRFRAYPAIIPAFALIVFRYYLHTKRFQRIAQWSTNIAHLSATRFIEMEIPLPPYAEQERIVLEAERCLSIAEKQKATIQTVLHRVATLRHRILHQAFSGKLVTQDSTEIKADVLVRQLMETNQSQEKEPIKPSTQPRLRRSSSIRSRRTLYDVLHDANIELKPEDLLRESGIGEDLIEEFFLELRHEISEGRIVERRDSNEVDVYLSLHKVKP